MEECMNQSYIKTGLKKGMFIVAVALSVYFSFGNEKMPGTVSRVKAAPADSAIVTSTYVKDANLLAYFYEITGAQSGKLTFGKLAAYTGKITVPKCEKLDGIGYATGASEFDLRGFTKYYIPDKAFKDHTNVQKVILPENITTIGEYAFSGCTNLRTINLPDKIQYIYGYAFANCASLSEVAIPAQIVEIGSGAFTNCSTTEKVAYEGEDEKMISLTKVVSGLSKIDFSKVTSGNEIEIGGGAFRAANITEITLPKGITCVNAYLFDSCSNLKTVVLPDTVTEIGDYAFQKCMALRTITMPFSANISKYAIYEYTGIEQGSFACQVKFIPAKTTKKIKVPLGEEIYLPGASYKASNIVGRKIKAVDAKGKDLLVAGGNGSVQVKYDSPNVIVKGISLGENTITVSADISFLHYVKGVEPDCEEITYKYTFSTSYNVSVVKEAVATPGKQAQVSNYKYQLTNKDIKGKITARILGVNGNLQVVEIPAKVKISGKTYKVTSIGKNFCKGNKKVRKVIIGKNVISIGKKAFFNCKNLKKIQIKTKKLTMKSVKKKVFYGIAKKAVIKVPKGKKTLYKKICKKKGAGKKVKIK